MKKIILLISFLFILSAELFPQNLNFNKVVLPTSSPYFSISSFNINNFLFLLQEDDNQYSIFLTSDNGLNWYISNKDFYFLNYAYTIKNNDRVYSVGLKSLWSKYDSLKNAITYSDDYCKTWKKLINYEDKNNFHFIKNPSDLNSLIMEIDSFVLRYDIQNRIFDTVLVMDKNHGYLIVNPFNNYYYSIFYKKLDKKFLISKDYGVKWDTVKANTPLGEYWKFLSEDDFYMHTIGQVFHSSDGGNYWESLYQADLEDDITDLEFWGRNMVFAKEKSIVYSKEPYIDFKETDISSLIKREINYIRISKDGHLFVRADDTLLYSADLKLAGLTVGAGTPGGSEKLCSIRFIGNKAVIETTGSIIGKINITDICGRAVYGESGSSARSEIELGGLQAGVYFISVVSPNGLIQAEKFVVY